MEYVVFFVGFKCIVFFQTSPSINGSTSASAGQARRDLRKIQDPSELKPITAKNTKNVFAPKEHSFRFRDPDAQSRAVILEDKSHLKEDVDIKSGKLACEGRVCITIFYYTVLHLFI